MISCYDYDVFISFAIEDKSYAHDLAEALTRLGFLSWFYDPDSIGGDEWTSIVRKALQSSASCVLLYGSSGKSPWVDNNVWSTICERLEHDYWKFRMIPVLLPGACSESSVAASTNFWSLQGYIQEDFVKFNESLNEEETLNELILKIRSVDLAESSYWRKGRARSILSRRLKAAFNIDWSELYWQVYGKSTMEHMQPYDAGTDSFNSGTDCEVVQHLLSCIRLQEAGLTDQKDNKLAQRILEPSVIDLGFNSHALAESKSCPGEVSTPVLSPGRINILDLPLPDGVTMPSDNLELFVKGSGSDSRPGASGDDRFLIFVLAGILGSGKSRAIKDLLEYCSKGAIIMIWCVGGDEIIDAALTDGLCSFEYYKWKTVRDESHFLSRLIWANDCSSSGGKESDWLMHFDYEQISLPSHTDESDLNITLKLWEGKQVENLMRIRKPGVFGASIMGLDMMTAIDDACRLSESQRSGLECSNMVLIDLHSRTFLLGRDESADTQN